jgi:hypothetical protein
VIAATNLDGHLDPAVWRRFDEIAWFDAPDTSMIGKYFAGKSCFFSFYSENGNPPRRIGG